LTISVSRRNFPRIKEKIRAMRREVLELAKADDQTDTVFHLNILAFPLSRWEKEKDPEASA
jgi:uncharacterized protein (TIGR02147 family)